MGSFEEIARSSRRVSTPTGSCRDGGSGRDPPMIREVSEALVDVVHQATPDLGDWMVLHSLSQGDPVTLPDNQGDPGADRGGGAPAPAQPSAGRGHHRPGPGPAVAAAALPGHLHRRPRRGPDPAGAASSRRSTPPRCCGRRTSQPPLADEVESLAIRLLDPTRDERNQIWGALGRAGRLALFYEVDVAPVAGPRARGRRPGARAPHRVRRVRRDDSPPSRPALRHQVRLVHAAAPVTPCAGCGRPRAAPLGGACAGPRAASRSSPSATTSGAADVPRCSPSPSQTARYGRPAGPRTPVRTARRAPWSSPSIAPRDRRRLSQPAPMTLTVVLTTLSDG